MAKKKSREHNSPCYWEKFAVENVYPTFDNTVTNVLYDEFLPQVRQEVSQGIADGMINFSLEQSYKQDFLYEANGIWFSIHIYIDNQYEVTNPNIRIFAIVPVFHSMPYVLRVYQEMSLRNRLDIYSPHFFVQYSSRSERLSYEAYKLSFEYKKFRLQESFNHERLLRKSIRPLHYFIKLFLSRNWLFLKCDDLETLSYKVQYEEEQDKEWTMVTSDSVLFGKTCNVNDCLDVVNVFLTNIDYGMLDEDQEILHISLKKSLELKYKSKMDE